MRQYVSICVHPTSTQHPHNIILTTSTQHHPHNIYTTSSQHLHNIYTTSSQNPGIATSDQIIDSSYSCDYKSSVSLLDKLNTLVHCSSSQALRPLPPSGRCLSWVRTGGRPGGAGGRRRVAGRGRWCLETTPTRWTCKNASYHRSHVDALFSILKSLTHSLPVPKVLCRMLNVCSEWIVVGEAITSE